MKFLIPNYVELFLYRNCDKMLQYSWIVTTLVVLLQFTHSLKVYL